MVHQPPNRNIFTMTEPKKAAKLIHAIKELSQRLSREQDLAIHQQINHFYFMEKAEELAILSEKLVALQKQTEALSTHLTKEYNAVFSYWSRSAKLYNRFLIARDCINKDV